MQSNQAVLAVFISFAWQASIEHYCMPSSPEFTPKELKRELHIESPGVDPEERGRHDEGGGVGLHF